MLHQGLVSLLAALQGELSLLLCTNQLSLHPPSWEAAGKPGPMAIAQQTHPKRLNPVPVAHQGPEDGPL